MTVKHISALSILLLFIVIAAYPAVSQNSDDGAAVDIFGHGRLQVSSDRRFLVHEDGAPFFWLGDTAWELFHRPTRAEITAYLDDRADRGFTVIQAALLAPLDGVRTPNRYGDFPFHGNDPFNPDVTSGDSLNEAERYDYWDHVDWVIQEAAARGLYIGLLPAWGDKVNPDDGYGPEIITVASAREYGAWIGTRYASYPNIIWIVGGDNAAVDGQRDDRATWRELGEGLQSADPNHLVTYYPSEAASSSLWFHSEFWLDFNMCQSGKHDAAYPVYDLITDDYEKPQPKPVILGGGIYENYPINGQSERGRFDDDDVRRAAWWSLFAGACGFTYGCNDVWQFYQTAYTPHISADTHWNEALSMPGASQMLYLKNLLLSRNYQSGIPDQTVIDSDNRSGASHQVALRGNDYLFVYLPSGGTVTVDSSGISGNRFTAWWYNPRDGSAVDVGIFPQTGSTYSFEASSQEMIGTDWVLVIDDVAAGYRAPGSI